MLKAIGKHAKGAKPGTLFNTHWHWDHTGSNERFGKAGAKIISHENTKLWLGADFTVGLGKSRLQAAAEGRMANQTFSTRARTASVRQPRVELRWLPRAHTDGDIYIHFPDQNVLVAGDLVSVGSYPILDVDTGGWIGGMVDANKALLDLCDDKTVIVPGSGPVSDQGRPQGPVRDDVDDAGTPDRPHAKGMGTDDILAQPPTGEFDAKWGDSNAVSHECVPGAVGPRARAGQIV